MSEHASKWQVRSSTSGTVLMLRHAASVGPDYFTDVARFDTANDARTVLEALRRDEGRRREDTV